MQGLLKAADVARRLNIARSSVYKLAELGKIPTVDFEIQVGDPERSKRRSCVRFRLEDVENFIQEHLKTHGS